MNTGGGTNAGGVAMAGVVTAGTNSEFTIIFKQPKPPSTNNANTGTTNGNTNTNTNTNSNSEVGSVTSTTPLLMTFEVTFKGNGWFSIGISSDGTMTSSGLGSDLIVCDNSGVKRYWSTAHERPITSTSLTDSTCTYNANTGTSVMTFTRTVLAQEQQGATSERSIQSNGQMTSLLWAFNPTDRLNFSPHALNKGSMDVDIIGKSIEYGNSAAGGSGSGSGTGGLSIAAIIFLVLTVVIVIFSIVYIWTSMKKKEQQGGNRRNNNNARTNNAPPAVATTTTTKSVVLNVKGSTAKNGSGGGGGGLKPGWKATQDGVGDTYYFNSSTGETTWDKHLVSL